MTDKKIILASASPRRRELLGHLDVEVEIAAARDVDESYPADLNPEQVAPYISRKKALGYADLVDERSILVTADTVVLLDGRVLGKPRDTDEARRMLRMLSGRTHVVITGVTVTSIGAMTTFSERTEVDFGELTDAEIDHYVTRYAPLDKAGAYGIQEWIGYIGVTGIRGDYYNVMGLPLSALYRQLKAL